MVTPAISSKKLSGKQAESFAASKRLTRKEAAEFLGVSESFLAQDMVHHRHKVPVAKCGAKCVYDAALLEQWLLKRTQNLPAEPANSSPARC